ncbi:MAG: chromosome segregation protein SMC [Cyclobacteriaceae bacterium]|nr:chromosome segregation protein SMC [Cyclobacteriaceae bacterium]
MQLAKLEIKGFKSFADKIVINFDEGITGIVGPNGCGKSNIVDSIRWVLGEQKTSALRSEKMENVIFNGTSGRSPLQMAEVSLTINNTKNILPTEYSQVTITRRLYRSGESEYLLNGVTCRLKDITNLFMDTGIASNSYAIIELGMVDDLLNDKDNSRRMLFEEAAGISKFKKRKKETLKKLEDTDADLERVEDLLFEIEKNMKSLEKQAKQTETYYRIKDEYKEKSITLAKVVVNQQKSRHDSIQKRIQDENDRKLELTSSTADKEASIEQAKADLIGKEKTLSSRQKSINEFVSRIRQYESDKQIKNERLKYLNDRISNLKEQIDQDKKSNERARFSIQSLESEKESAQLILTEITQKLDSLKAEYEEQKTVTASLQSEVDSLRQVQRTKQEESFQINKAVEIREIQINSFKQELERTASDTSQQSASLVEFEKKLVELQEEINKKNELLESLKREEEDTLGRISSMEKTIEMIREELTSISRKLDARQNEYNLTKSLVENLEGFPEAIKFLKKRIAKNAPLLSDILTCPEEYRVPIENYLESYLNYYIVDHESEAYEAINILSDASKGKANFFILDAFEKFDPTPTRIYDNAFPATQIIEFDPKYRKLMSFILDRVYIYEGGDIKGIPAEDDNIFITKSGKFTKRRFSLSGGSVGLFEGKRIGRAKNLEKLDKEIRELTGKLNTTRESLVQRQSDLEKLRNHTIRQQIEEIQNSIRQTNEEYVSIRTKSEQFSQLLSNSDLRREDILEKIDSLLKELDELKPRAQQLNHDVLLHETQMSEITGKLSSQNDLLSQKSAAFNEQNIFFHQQENRVKSIDQEIRFKQESMEQSSQRIELNLEELKKNEEEIKGIIESTHANDNELIAMYAEKEEMEKGLNEAEKDYYQTRGDIDQLEKDLREVQHARNTIDNLLMELQNQLNESKLQLNSVKERLSVEFNVDLDALTEQATPEESETLASLNEEKLRQEVSRIRERLDNMGPINPMAMEAYTEIKERNDFIIAQKEDLTKAKESLLSTITEIEGAASVTFMEAFNQIRDHFKRVFRSLFNEEDDCDLKLVDPNNPLESEIDIMAKPKGKRPLTINQLSGGEKTLTATALLFSMYLLKPAPFCIFDEVDAPLDDANIDKFNNIIRTFSKDSQFVIVTHNKRTMTSTDVIYGITMVEKGVSKVVPVDLRELA